MKTVLEFGNLIKFLFTLFLVACTGMGMKAQSYVISNCSQFKWVLAVPNANYANNQQLIIWDFNDNYGDQKFYLYKRPNGNVTIMPNDNRNMAIAIPCGIIEQNQSLILWESNNNLDQQWELQHLEGMKYIIRSCVNRDYVLAPISGSLDARIVIQRYTGAEHQQWAVMSTTGNFFNNIYKNVYVE